MKTQTKTIQPLKICSLVLVLALFHAQGMAQEARLKTQQAHSVNAAAKGGSVRGDVHSDNQVNAKMNTGKTLKVKTGESPEQNAAVKVRAAQQVEVNTANGARVKTAPKKAVDVARPAVQQTGSALKTGISRTKGTVRKMPSVKVKSNSAARVKKGISLR